MLSKRKEAMKKLLIVVLGLVLTLSVAGAGLAADPPAQAQPQTTCPVLGNKINKDVYADYQGKRVYFCCSDCIGVFQKDPDKYLKKLSDQGVTPAARPTGK